MALQYWGNRLGDGVVDATTDPVTGEVGLIIDGERTKLGSNVLVPRGDLTLSLSASLSVPLSIGIDGLVYGSTGLGSKTLTRSDTAFVTQEDGATLPSVHTIIFATRVTEGYLAITSAELLFGSPGSNSHYSVGAEIWFSTQWGSGWSKVKDIGRTQGIGIGRPIYSAADGGTIMTVGEYSNTPGQTHTLWLTKDGGQTWNAIHALVAVNATKNNHYHGSGYDLITGRIYASHGDAENAWFGYSPDFGATWVPLPAAGMDSGSVSIYHQPVICDACQHGIVTTPDAATGTAGVWMVGRSDGYATPAYSLAELPSNQYAEAPVGADGNYIRYTVHPMRGARTSNKVYILASGDGGQSWWKVYEAAQAATQYYERGVVGPDRNGKLFIHCRDNATNQLYIADQLLWQYYPEDRVKASGGSLEDLLVAAGLLQPGTPLPVDTLGATVTAGNLALNAIGAKLTIGGPSGVAVIDTPASVSQFRQLVKGHQIYELSATAGVYGQVEFSGPLTYIKFTGATGGMIATQASQKMAFWGATPVVRQTGTPAAATDLATALTLVNDLRAKLLTIGLIG